MQKSWCNSVEGNGVFSKAATGLLCCVFHRVSCAIHSYTEMEFLFVCINRLWILKATWILGPTAHMEISGLLLLWLWKIFCYLLEMDFEKET